MTPITEPMPPRSTPWPARILIVLFAAVVVPISSAVLYTHPPTQYSFLPCPFYWATGLHCPGCGATRCTYALMHGELRQAVAYNLLLVMMLPMIAYFSVRVAYELWTGKNAPGPSLPIWLQRAFLVLVIAYWIARNINVAPFTFLAPHEI